MRKYSIHIMCFLCCLLSACHQEHETNWDISLDRNDKSPYGCFIAYQSLKDIFPSSVITSGTDLMKQVKKLNEGDEEESSGHAIIVVTNHLNIDSIQFQALIQFVKRGNVCCLFTAEIPTTMASYFSMHAEVDSGISRKLTFDTTVNQSITLMYEDTLHDYSFHGLPIAEQSLIQSDSSMDETLWTDQVLGYQGKVTCPNVLMRHIDEGAFMIGSSPLTFSNYFLLQGGNRNYYEYLLSWINTSVKSVTWYSYPYITADREFSSKKWFEFPPLFFAFLSVISLFLLYVLFEGKRRYRAIDVIVKKGNASLEFAETVGLLYFNKGDHRNLSEKMIRHYQDHIRLKYNYKIQNWDEETSIRLANLLSQPLKETNEFISYINYICHSSTVEETDIKNLYFLLKKFM